MDNHRIRRPINQPRPDDDDLRSYIEGDSADEIVRQVSDAFAQRLSEILKKGRAGKRASDSEDERRL
ncbi:hypothetical protein ABIE78_003539 [Sinorhizobium fredii]